ncbi:phosphatase PAP2 family protein [Salinicoccus carnicancri]|uniref:phosphatase PAP2 family protein n=1 Tax=Salinicoccus carnicancri TaxID=558170 RepID=UPI0002EB58F5|nr:phosphatase PAP2 family protein [Salinicoccus carnicancri]
MKKSNIYFIPLYAALFAILAISIRLGFTDGADRLAYLFLRKFADAGWLEGYLSSLSRIFKPFHATIIFIIVTVIYYFKKDPHFWLYTIGAGASLAIGTAMKYTFQRARPDVEHAAFDGYSFPSMHVLSFMVLVTLMFRLSRNIYIRAVLVFLVISMMISRIYLGAHYLSDTVASVIVIALILHVMEEVKTRYSG